MRPITTTLTGTGIGAPVVIPHYASTDYFTVQVSNGGGFNYTVQTTNLSPYAWTSTGPAYADAAAFSNAASWSNTAIAAATATGVTAQIPAAAAVRLIQTTTAGAGPNTMTVLVPGAN